MTFNLVTRLLFFLKANSPAEVYNFFIDRLVETVVLEIARCLEKSYDTISLTEVAKRLNFKNKAEVESFGQKVYLIYILYLFLMSSMLYLISFFSARMET